MVAQLEETKSKHLMTIDGLEQSLRGMKKKLLAKSDAFEVLEKEYNKIQERIRDGQNVEFNLATRNEHQEATMKI